ncbi:MAG TPA: endonuclease/exonuclease/phosphatase family protein [Actinocrinis sp.]|jgi:endonuclease/exonuclease/phosphatase family metal-dependent hydrolase
MRLATFNVLHGRPLGADGRPVGPPDAAPAQQPFADAVSDLDADVLALQEVDRYQARSGDVDQALIAATAMGAADWRYASALHGRAVRGAGWELDRSAPALGVYGPHGAYGPDGIPVPSVARSHGIALLTRRPVLEWRARRLLGVPASMPLAVVGRKALTLVRDHPRVAVAAVLEGARGPFTVVATHLSFVPGWNVGQLAVLHTWLADMPRPHVLLGDLNLIGPVPRAVLMGRELVDSLVRRRPIEHTWHDLARTATYPAHRPLVQFDHILAAGVPRSAVRISAAPQAAISDHRALVVELSG